MTDIGESVFDALPTSGIKRTQILEVLAKHSIGPAVEQLTRSIPFAESDSPIRER